MNDYRVDLKLTFQDGKTEIHECFSKGKNESEATKQAIKDIKKLPYIKKAVKYRVHKLF